MKTKLVMGFMALLCLLSMFAGCSNSTANSATKTIKIGMVAWLGFPIGLDEEQGTQVMVDMDNANGGLLIGGQRYKVQLVVYDSNNVQATEVSDVNKLISVDKVKYILASEEYVSSWISTADKSKVLVFGGSPTDAQLQPNLKYSFNPNFNRTGNSIIIGWFCKKYPDLAKNIVYAYPDSQMGHSAATSDTAVFEALGAKFTPIFYPANSTDLSSLGTQVKNLNPTAFGAAGAGPNDVLAMKAARDAGYTGQLFADSGASAGSYVALAGAQNVEGILMGAEPAEFDSPPTKMATDIKAAWIAKYGKWEGPELMGTGSYAALRTALQQANSLDPDKLANVLSNGMKYSAPLGDGEMVSRPDLGNNRTVDSACTTYIKTIKNGQPVLVDTVPLDEGLQYVKLAFPVK